MNFNYAFLYFFDTLATRGIPINVGKNQNHIGGNKLIIGI